MATYSSILAWRTPWTEESGGLQFMGSQRVGHDWVTNTTTQSLGKHKKNKSQQRGSLQKTWPTVLKIIKVTIWPSNPTTGHKPWENHNSKRHMYSNAGLEFTYLHSVPLRVVKYCHRHTRLILLTLYSPHVTGEETCAENLSHLPKATQLICIRDRIWTQAICFQSGCS